MYISINFIVSHLKTDIMKTRNINYGYWLLFFFSILFFLPINGTAQEDLVYTMKFGASLKTCDINGQNQGDNQTIRKGWDFRIENVASNGDYVIYLLDCTKDCERKTGERNFQANFVDKNYYKLTPTKFLKFKENREINKANKNVKKDLIFYYFPKKKFEEIAIPIPKVRKVRFTYGAMTLPIKLRFKEKIIVDKLNVKTNLIEKELDSIGIDFVQDIQLGASFGWRYHPTGNPNWGFNFLGSLGIIAIDVDEVTTNGKYNLATDPMGITTSAGISLQYKTFQIGLSLGWDFLTRELSKNWVYQKKPWLGIGVGIGLYKEDAVLGTDKQSN